MNALVSVRNNFLGNLVPTPAERAQTMREANYGRPGAMAPLATVQKALKQAETGGVSRTVNSELDRDAFLQLLVFQLQNQDPLQPIQNTEMIAQLAQFSALEQMNNLNDQFGALSSNLDQLNFISANSLIGRTVEGIDTNGLMRTGVVERVHLDGSVVLLTVDGALMSMAGVLSIKDSPPPEK